VAPSCGDFENYVLMLQGTVFKYVTCLRRGCPPFCFDMIFRGRGVEKLIMKREIKRFR